MMRGTFANVRIRNPILPKTRRRVYHILPHRRGRLSLMRHKYKATQTPLVVLAGTQYGTGSSRDWAAKGTLLLGVKAVISKTLSVFIAPTSLVWGFFRFALKKEKVPTDWVWMVRKPSTLRISTMTSRHFKIYQGDSSQNRRYDHFVTTVRLDTPVEVEYYCNGGILQTVVRNLATSRKSIASTIRALFYFSSRSVFFIL